MINRVNNYFLVGLMLLLGISIFKMFAPFFVTIIMAFIFWQIFKEYFYYLEKQVKNSKFASFLTCFLITLLVVVPVFVFGTIASKEAFDVYSKVSKDSSMVISFENKVKTLLLKDGGYFGIDEAQINDYFSSVNLNEAAKSIAGVVAGLLQQAYTELSWFIFLVFVMLFALYYLFLDGDKFLKYLFHLSPLAQKDEDTLLERFMSMSRATLWGSAIIGLIQGLLGGLTFLLLGVGSPVFWGLMMAVFSVLPLIGPAAVWVPVSIWLIATGEITKGLILIFVGALVIGSVDNLLRSKLVGKDTSIHPVLILLGTFGGIAEFGALGFIVGPVLVSIFMTLLEIFDKKVIKRD